MYEQFENRYERAAFLRETISINNRVCCLLTPDLSLIDELERQIAHEKNISKWFDLPRKHIFLEWIDLIIGKKEKLLNQRQSIIRSLMHRARLEAWKKYYTNNKGEY